MGQYGLDTQLHMYQAALSGQLQWDWPVGVGQWRRAAKKLYRSLPGDTWRGARVRKARRAKIGGLLNVCPFARECSGTYRIGI